MKMILDFPAYTKESKIFLYGAGQQGKRDLKLLKDIGITVSYFCDVDSQKWNTKIDGTPVISPMKLKEIDENESIVIVISVNSFLIKQVYDNLQKLTLKTDKIITLFHDKSTLVAKQFDKEKVILRYIEMNIVDGCNLNCKGCGHFSNLFDKKAVYELEQYKKDLTEIAKHCEVLLLQLLGGEPLLCDELHEYVDFARKNFPNTDINIVTNGLLIFNQQEYLFECMKRNNVGFAITPYKPTLKYKDKIIEFLKQRGVNFYFIENGGGGSVKFAKALSATGDSDMGKSMSSCLGNNCRFLRNGKLYKCPLEGLIYKYFDTFNIKNNLKCGIDIYSITDWNKVIDELATNPVEACRYCSEKQVFMDWQISESPCVNDWVTNK